MKAFLVVTIFGLVAARPQAPEPQPLTGSVRAREELPPRPVVPILRDSRNGPDGDGNFNFRYETGDGIVHEAQGTNDGDGIVRVSGSFSYLSPEGEPIDITYTADENGFQAFGAAVPTPPPMPPHALAQLKAAQQAFLGLGLRFDQPAPVAPLSAPQAAIDYESEGHPGK